MFANIRRYMSAMLASIARKLDAADPFPVLTESRLILPLNDNKGESLWLIHASLRRDLLATFGGFSESALSGSWRDESTGLTYSDESVAYDIAADWNNPDNCEKLNRLASRYCALAEQVTMYLRHGNGAVAYISPDYLPPDAQTLAA